MPQKMSVWRKKARAKLIAELTNGKNCCVTCGSTQNLVIAHHVPLTEEQAEYRSKIGSSCRLVLYRREAKEGLVTVRCQSCNIKQSKEVDQGWLPLYMEAPF